MRVVFRKDKRGGCYWTAYRPKRRPASAGGGTVGRALPHDLLQFVVEREHGIRHGFWGCLADGATFRSLAKTDRKPTRPGRAVIAAHVDELDAVELLVGRELEAWFAGEDTPVTRLLAAMREQWLAMNDGDELELEFAPVVTRPRPKRLEPGRRRVSARLEPGG